MNFSTENPFVTFFFNEKDDSDGFIEIRTLNAAKAKEISKKTTKKKVEYPRGKRFEVEVVNDELREKLTWDYCIGKWSQVNDDNGNEYENTVQNKVDLMNNSNAFASYVAECMEKIDEADNVIQEQSEKN